jgi:hypothetical protein
VQIYGRILSASGVMESSTLGPWLSFTRTGNQLTFSWPGSGFVLQQNSSVVNPTGWSNVTGGASSPVPVTVPPTGNSYFRLQKQ